MQSIVDEKAAAFHVAIIMDGNGRWATRRGLPRSAGHQAGVRAARLVTQAAPDLGVTTLSLFAFSSDNWQRPRAEVNALMSLLRHYLACELRHLVENGIRLTVIGRRDRLPAGLRTAIQDAEQDSAKGARLNLRIAIDYSSRDAIIDTAFRSCTGPAHGVSFVHRPGAVTRRLCPDARPRRRRYRRRSSHPLRRREAVVGFSAVGMRLRRALLPRHPVARLRRRPSGGGHC